MTRLQNEMLTKIAESEYNQLNGDIPETLDEVGEIWASEIIETQADKGTFTSLLNVGCVGHNMDSGTMINADGDAMSDATVWLTENGFNAYKEFRSSK